jgi:hypothetical protein
VYPNPTKDVLNVEILDMRCEDMRYETCDIAIYDVYGRNVSNLKSQNLISINVSHLPTGIYILRVGGQTVKFVKQ